MYVETEGIILKDGGASGNAKLLTILTAEKGKVQAVARGAKSIRSGLAAASNLFVYSRFVLFRNRDRYIVDSAEPAELFFELRNDIRKLSLAQYFAELTLSVAEEDMPSAGILSLLANTLYVLSKKDKNPDLVKSGFELRLLSLCGYMPDLEGCAACGKTEPGDAYFNPKDGNLICAACAGEDIRYTDIRVSQGIIDAMRHITGCDIRRLFSFQLPDQTARLLSSITECFAEKHLDRRFPTLEFYTNLRL